MSEMRKDVLPMSTKMGSEAIHLISMSVTEKEDTCRGAWRFHFTLIPFLSTQCVYHYTIPCNMFRNHTTTRCVLQSWTGWNLFTERKHVAESLTHKYCTKNLESILQGQTDVHVLTHTHRHIQQLQNILPGHVCPLPHLVSNQRGRCSRSSERAEEAGKVHTWNLN